LCPCVDLRQDRSLDRRNDVTEPETGTFLFADLAGFTALTEAHGDQEAAELAAGYFDSVRALLPEHEGEEIKVIGDELMLRCSSASHAVRLATSIVHDVGAQHGFPSVRVGLHTGPAIKRDRDWFGATVNLAARIAAEAGAGQILLSDASRQAAGKVEGIEFEPRGRRQLRNVREPVLLFAAAPAGERDPHELPIDPVCRMAVDPSHSAGTLRHQGVAYHFCSMACAQAFAAEPSQYRAGGAAGSHPQPPDA
jgi:adenylate cyclase